MTYRSRSEYQRQWLGQFDEEQKMRNTIKVLDPSWPRVGILSLKPGELFQYTARKNDDAVYMKLDGLGDGAKAVLLANGMVYNVAHDTSISRVSLVEIGTSI